MGVWLTVLEFSSVVFFNKSKCCSFDFIVNINSILNTNQSFFAKRNICYQRNTHPFLGVFLVNLKQNYWVLNVKKISSSYKTLLLIRENLEYFYKPIMQLTRQALSTLQDLLKVISVIQLCGIVFRIFPANSTLLVLQWPFFTEIFQMITIGSQTSQNTSKSN